MFDMIQGIYEFFTTGIYDFVVEAYAWVIIKIAAFQLKATIASIEFAWDIAKEIITQLNISAEMQVALERLPPDVVSKLNFFNVINGLNLLLNAFVTRFVMRFI
ncbi:DUF2523 family protein [Pseudoalteromonas denitrificans]|uniref:DUF2523 domain-containing protein n=1 Tax=Pseudoalteromonas denitrificans DSM 6059 TaxID=1123010 RepID=A0A1I1ETN3_9GAMM|nr:DUF2523 family protein [Pseudoalteromonas denitrificans]SFB90495.1 Protein of unknown function [Pseudoalteromonas denitrificans DSM 6059]